MISKRISPVPARVAIIRVFRLPRPEWRTVPYGFFFDQYARGLLQKSTGLELTRAANVCAPRNGCGVREIVRHHDY